MSRWRRQLNRRHRRARVAAAYEVYMRGVALTIRDTKSSFEDLFRSFEGTQLAEPLFPALTYGKGHGPTPDE